MAKVHTYNPRQVSITVNNTTLLGVADDQFITIEPNADVATKRVGCYGDVVRSISPDRTYNLRVVLLYNAEGNKLLESFRNKDVNNGDGMFPISIYDKKGNCKFYANEAWVSRAPSRVYGREAPNLEWMISTGEGGFLNDN